MSRDSQAPRNDPAHDRNVRAGGAAVRLRGVLVDVEERLRRTRRSGPPGPGQSPPRSSRDQLTSARIGAALDALDIRYLTDGEGSLVAVWERHAMLFTVEGPRDEILVMRARPHTTVPAECAERAYRMVNEWNRTRRFGKAYVGDPMCGGLLPLHAELEVPLESGVHEALLVELLECGTAVATEFVAWLHGEGCLR